MVQALWLKPQLLIIDEPYTGLDKNSRAQLNAILTQIANQGTTLILITNDNNIPSIMNRFAEIIDGAVREVDSTADFTKDQVRVQKTLPYFLQQAPTVDADTMLELKDVIVRYGEKVVLNKVSWTVKKRRKMATSRTQRLWEVYLIKFVEWRSPTSLCQ